MVTYLLHIYGYFDLKYYADLKRLCSVATCIVDILILDKHYAFCHLENFGRLLIVKPRVNMPSMIGVFVW